MSENNLGNTGKLNSCKVNFLAYLSNSAVDPEALVAWLAKGTIIPEREFNTKIILETKNLNRYI